MRTNVRVRLLRTKLRLTQEQMAKRVGVSFATINRWENSHFKPTPLARKRIQELESEIETK